MAQCRYVGSCRLFDNSLSKALSGRLFGKDCIGLHAYTRDADLATSMLVLRGLFSIKTVRALLCLCRNKHLSPHYGICPHR